VKEMKLIIIKKTLFFFHNIFVNSSNVVFEKKEKQKYFSDKSGKVMSWLEVLYNV